MHCPRVDHFVKLHPIHKGGVVRLCCHMIDPPSFTDYETMMKSEWVKDIRTTFDSGQFPKECIRCKIAEDSNHYSIRLSAIEEHSKQSKQDYLVADIMLDNICNLGCQFCSPMASTKIGSLHNPKGYIIYDNNSHFDKLPLDRITQLDLAGGEPSHSKNIKNLLLNLPKNVNSIRVNTNCTSFMDELIPLLVKGINISITVSLDGVNETQEYVRWPTKWDNFYNVLLQYIDLQKQFPDNLNLNFWTTINALNINNFIEIKTFAEQLGIPLTHTLLQQPLPLNIKFKNIFTNKAKENKELANIFDNQLATDIDNQTILDNFIKIQDGIRGIKIKDYIST